MTVNQRERYLSPEHIYYDIQIYNKYSQSGDATPIYFNESRNSSFIKYASDYYLSIIRFQCDTTSLPSYEVVPLPGDVNPNKLIYSITLEKTIRADGSISATSQQYLIWSPENKNSNLGDNDYYFGNSMTYLTQLINNAIVAAFIQIDGVQLDYLFCQYDIDLSKLLVYGLYDRCSENGANLHATKYNLYFNRELQSLFSTLSYDRYYTATLGRYYRLRFDYSYNTGKFNGNQDYIINKQQFDTSANISPVASICFTTNLLPVVKNELSAPIIYKNGVLETSSNNNNFINLITDISANDNFYKSNILYNPTAEYRLIDLNMTSRPINNIDFNCLWKHKNGKFYQLYLYSNGSASIKFMFKKKETEFIQATENLI